MRLEFGHKIYFGVCQALSSADCVYHQVAIALVQKSAEDPPPGTGRGGVEGILIVLSVAARDVYVGRVVFSSSAAVYEDSPDMPKREDMLPEPKSPYVIFGWGCLCLAFNELLKEERLYRLQNDYSLVK